MTMWVAAAQFGAASLNLFSEWQGAKADRAMAGVVGRMERRQIALQSRFDAQQRVRQTGSLISSQRSAMAQSGVAGGRTARLLEAHTRNTMGRQQAQADIGRVYQEASSQMGQQAANAQARRRVTGAAINLLASGADYMQWRDSLPPED